MRKKLERIHRGGGGEAEVGPADVRQARTLHKNVSVEEKAGGIRASNWHSSVGFEARGARGDHTSTDRGSRWALEKGQGRPMTMALDMGKEAKSGNCCSRRRKGFFYRAKKKRHISTLSRVNNRFKKKNSSNSEPRGERDISEEGFR